MYHDIDFHEKTAGVLVVGAALHLDEALRRTRALSASLWNVTRRHRTDRRSPQLVDVRAKNPAFSGAIAVA